jgi:flagellar M-ring protein FliF
MSFLRFTKDDIVRGVELGVMALLGLLVLLLIVRPITRRIFAPIIGAAATGEAAAAAPGGITLAAGGPNFTIAPSPPPIEISNRTSEMIDIAQVQGQVHAQSVQKVGEIADKNPNETVAIVRNWLHENAA